MSRNSIYSASGSPGKRLQKSPRFSGLSRLQEHAKNNLGVIYGGGGKRNAMFRDDCLDLLDQYYDGTQYANLIPWDDATRGVDEKYVPVRQRQPRINYRAPKVLVDKVTAKIVGASVFPKFKIEDDPDDSNFFRTVAKAANLRKGLMEPVRYALTAGSSFCRYYIVNGAVRMEAYKSKYCYPVFDDAGELESVTIKYIYEDQEDRDAQGNFKLKWYRLDLSKASDIMYDNPEYQENVTNPQFNVVEEMPHGLGWVQGEWLRTGEDRHCPDGPSLIEPIMDFFDELNYSLSQTSQAVSYNQDPQLVFKGMDEEETEKLIRSSQKGWHIGRDTASAEFLETELGGVKTAEETRDHMRGWMLDVARVVLHDPEKMVAAAQSGKALEVLNAPLVELVDELRTMFEPSFRNLLIKIGMTLLHVMAAGAETILEVPPKYSPSSLDLVLTWPPIYPLTLEDLLKKSQIATAITQAKVISHETITHWLAPDFGVEDIDEELAKIEDEGVNQPWLNPFGMGMDGAGGF